MERPRVYLDTKETASTEFEDLLRIIVSPDVKGVSYFSLSIDPDPSARYQIIVGHIYKILEVELTAIWSLLLPHLTNGVYRGFDPSTPILLRHRSVTGATVKTAFTLAFNEVVIKEGVK